MRRSVASPTRASAGTFVRNSSTEIARAVLVGTRVPAFGAARSASSLPNLPRRALTMYRLSICILATFLLPALGDAQKEPPARHDTAFASMQERGRLAMGVDQYTSTHHF